MRPLITRTVGVIVAGAAIVATAAAGHPKITKAGLEQALAPTFANLYVQQSHILGIPGITTATIGATTSCDKGGPKVKDEGAGPNWICMTGWTDNHGQHQDGKFEVTVEGAYQFPVKYICSRRDVSVRVDAGVADSETEHWLGRFRRPSRPHGRRAAS